MAIIVFFNIHSHRKPENVKKRDAIKSVLSKNEFVCILLVVRAST